MNAWGKFHTLSLKAAVSMALCALIGSPVMAAPNINPPVTSNTQAGKIFQACKTLRRCVDILERHADDSFDYTVLAQDFARFGIAAREVLWRLIAPLEKKTEDKDAQELGLRALDILSRSPVILPPKEQRRMVELWTSQTASPRLAPYLLRLMRTHMSPLVRSTAIQTLDHPQPEVRAYSRALLNEAVHAKMDFPMRSADFAPLSQAVLTTPNAELVTLTALYPSEQVAPVLARILSSGDVPSVIAAYDALYKNDEEAAFKALIATLYGLGDGDAKAAIAIGGLLAHRHPLREDGFYMKFAAELSADSQMSALGRVAGFDALMRRAGEKGVPELIDSPLSAKNFALAVRAFKDGDIPPAYFAFVAQLSPKTADAYLAPLKANALTLADQRALISLAGNFDTLLAKNLVKDAFDTETDYKLEVAAIFAHVAQSKKGDMAIGQKLTSLVKTHPIIPVRAAASLGLDALSAPSPRKAIAAKQAEWSRRGAALLEESRFCTIKTTHLRADARAMPFYQPALLAGFKESSRAQLTSGARVKNGWLAAYASAQINNKAVQPGGLVRYENASGAGRELFEDSDFGPQSVSAVMPITPPPLGQTASQFWVFATSLETGEPALYRAVLTLQEEVSLSRERVLPAPPLGFAQNVRGEVSIVMGRGHPPLRLLENGQLTQACKN